MVATQVPGFHREVLALDLPSFQRRFPAAEEDVYHELNQVLSTISLSTFDVLACAQFGKHAQQQLTRWIDKLIAVVNDESVRAASRHVQRLLGLLQGMAQAYEASRFPWPKQETPSAQLKRIQPEINQLKTLLVQGADAFNACQNELADISNGFVQSRRDLQVLVLACDVIRSECSDEVTSIVGDRVISLSKSLALLLEQEIQMASFQSDLFRLRSMIDEVVLVSLPAWMSMVAMNHGSNMTETDKFIQKEGLAALLASLT